MNGTSFSGGVRNIEYSNVFLSPLTCMDLKFLYIELFVVKNEESKPLASLFRINPLSISINPVDAPKELM